MVSSDLTSVTIRGPASVAGHGPSSRHNSLSSSRARRYNRSHAGGVSFVPQNEFPVFSQSGDVEIIVRVASGHENRYLLHRDNLIRYSGFFEASTSDEWSRAQQAPEPTLPPTAGAIEAPPKISDSSPGTARDGEVRGSELARLTEQGRNSSVSTIRPLATSLSSPRRRWRYELDFGTGKDDIPVLIQKDENNAPPASSNMPSSTSIFGGSPRQKVLSSSAPTHSNSFFRSVANLSLSPSSMTQASLPPPTQGEQDLLRDYDNLFRIMYNYPPLLDSIDITTAYVQCKSLLTLADQYDALPVVGPRVDHHLLQFQSGLWKQIAKYPVSYIRIGYMARSKVIYKEALIHVVGQWPTCERSLRSILPDSVLEIIEDKVDDLEELVHRVESRLFRLTLTTRAGERVSPQTNYLDWLAVSLFRQWLADNTAPPAAPVPDRTAGRRDAAPNGNSSGNGNSAAGTARSNSGVLAVGRAVISVPSLASLGRAYRTLGSPAGNYLGHEDCKRFLKLTPELYTRDHLRKFEKRIEEIKAMVREVVKPLMGGQLELETSTDGRGIEGISYLTCTAVGKRDLPWI